MAKYRASSRTYVFDRLIDPNQPGTVLEFKVPDGTIPSRVWVPLDDAAHVAFNRYIVAKGGTAPPLAAVDMLPKTIDPKDRLDHTQPAPAKGK